MNPSIKLAPSILSANFAALGDSLRTLEAAGAHMIHFDVMDGHFVPNLSFGLPVLGGIRPLTKLPFDVHLMIANPLLYLERYIQAGADELTVHHEVMADLPACLSAIRALGAKCAFAVNPTTPVRDVLHAIEHADRVLVMSVQPGFGGQAFMPQALQKAEAIADFAAQKGLTIEIEMDGGIDATNVASVLSAGVSVVVAGSALFDADPDTMTQNIRLFLQAMNVCA
jgi:ribulose-phosphate 3-epimerase